MSDLVLPDAPSIVTAPTPEITVKKKLYLIANAILENNQEKAHFLIDDLFTTVMAMIATGQTKEPMKLARICLRAHAFALQRGYTPG